MTCPEVDDGTTPEPEEAPTPADTTAVEPAPPLPRGKIQGAGYIYRNGQIIID